MKKKSSGLTTFLFAFITAFVMIYAFVKYVPSFNMAMVSPNKEEIKEVIRDFINENPELIISSIENMQLRKARDSENQQRNFLTSNKDLIEDANNTPVIGNENGKIVMVEFYDYLCGYCKRASQNLKLLIESDKDVKVVLRDHPILGKTSEKAALAAIAMYQISPSKHLEFHNALMRADIKRNEPEKVMELAEKTGVNMKELEKKMQSKEVIDILANNRMIASKAGVNGTPAFIIGDRLIPGSMSLEDMRKRVAEAKSASSSN